MLDKVFGPPLASAGRNVGMRFETAHPLNSQNKQTLQPNGAGGDTAFPAGPVVSDSPPASKSSATTVSGRSLREEIDTYPAVAVLNSRWRVVVCKHSIQWILQRRGGERWRSQYFCRSRLGLILCVREYAGQISGDALVILLRLPEWIGGGHG
jgi:hypothetical protein